MKGLVEEGSEVLEEDGESAVIDAALIGAAQRVEHYEIAAYGTVRAMANQLGHSDVADLLDQTIKEEGAADKKLTDISENEVLDLASQNKDDDSEEDGNNKAHSGSQKSRNRSGNSKSHDASSTSDAP